MILPAQSSAVGELPLEETLDLLWRFCKVSISVVREEDKNWKGRIVFVDQFKRKSRSEELFEFTWGGGKSAASSPVAK